MLGAMLRRPSIYRSIPSTFGLADVSDDSEFFMSQDSFGENAQVDRQGNFTWKDVIPGNYVLRLYGGNGQDSFFQVGHASA